MESKRFGDLLAHEIGGGWGQDEPLGNETEEAYVIRGTDIPELEEGNLQAVGLRYHNPPALKKRSSTWRHHFRGVWRQREATHRPNISVH